MDLRLLGVISLAWNIMTCKTPKEIIDSIHEAIDESGMPKEMELEGEQGVFDSNILILN